MDVLWKLLPKKRKRCEPKKVKEIKIIFKNRFYVCMIIFLSIGMPVISQTYGLSGEGLSEIGSVPIGSSYGTLYEQKDDSAVIINIFSWSSQYASGAVTCTHNNRIYNPNDDGTTISIQDGLRFGLYHFEYDVSAPQGGERHEVRDVYVIKRVGPPSVHGVGGNPYGVKRIGANCYFRDTFDFNGMMVTDLYATVQYVLSFRDSAGTVSQKTIDDAALNGTYSDVVLDALAVTGRCEVTVAPTIFTGKNQNSHKLSTSNPLVIYVDALAPKITVNPGIKTTPIQLVWKNENTNDYFIQNTGGTEGMTPDHFSCYASFVDLPDETAGSTSTTSGISTKSICIIGPDSKLANTIERDKKYKFELSAQDKCGNTTSMRTSFGFSLDSDPPLPIDGIKAVWQAYKAGSPCVDALNISWKATSDISRNTSESESGVKGYKIYKKTIGGSPSFVDVTGQNKGAGTVDGIDKEENFTFEFSTDDEGENYEFVIIPEDNVGNKIDPGNPTDGLGRVRVCYAPLLKVISADARLLKVGSPTSSDIIVESVLSVTPEEFKNGYQYITMKRQGIGIDDPQGMTFSPADVVKSGESPAAHSWLGEEVQEDGSTVLVYHDQVPAQYGHRNLHYEIEQKRKAPQIIQPDGTPGTESPVPTENTGNDLKVSLPNHWGYLGSIYLADDPDPKKEGRKTLRVGEKKTDFQIGESLKTWLAFTAGDIDAGTSWQYAAYHATPIGDASYEVYAESRLNEDPEKEYAKDILSTPRDELAIPVVLNYGINNIVVSWQEISPEKGVAEEDGHPYEMVLSVKVTKTLDGGYELEAFGDTAVHGTDGLICRPGEPVTFALRNGVGRAFSCSWDFNGDGEEDSSSLVVENRYLQKDDRTGDVSEYTLVLTIKEPDADPKEVSLAVHVKDTRQGRLYVSELWRGDHQILGTVAVPANGYDGNAVTLSLEPGIDKTMTVSFDRDEVLKPQLGISVESGGRLEIGAGGGTVVLRMKEGQTPYWDAIRIRGSAFIQNAKIGGAERAVAVGGSGIADMSDVELSGNKIGLHIVGSEAKVTVKNAKIKQNTEYGVKEDSGGNPAFGGSASDSEERNVEVSENYRNYYDWREGLLSAEEQEAVNGIIRK